MARAATFAVALLIALGGWAHANDTATSPEIINGEDGWITHDRQEVLLIETSTTALPRALDALGVSYDYFNGSDWSGLALADYNHVLVGMDGGLVEEPSIANVAGFVAAGGCLHFYGGTCWQPYAIAMDTHLLSNNVNDYCWTTVSGQPHSTIVDAGHYLATGLPGTYNFADLSATYYQMRTDDAAIAVAAVNGDGYDHLLSKVIGAGHFDICINSPYDSYYGNPGDFDWLTQVVANMVIDGPSPADQSTWGSIKALYR
jgi:hypothetical protein